LEKYKEDYIKENEEKGNPNNYNVHEITMLAETHAKLEVKKQEAHLKAYLKGKTHYKLYGRKFPVITPELQEKKEENE
jgi:hypothetical protein